MEQHRKIERCPSFSFYASDTLTSTTAAKVIREEQVARFHEFGDVTEDDFEFALESSDDEVSATETDSRGLTVFPVFNRDLLVEVEVDREVKTKDGPIHASSSITGSLRKLFIKESCSSSEADELETLPSGTYCVWRPNGDGGSSPVLSKVKKSSSLGSGSKRWSIRYLLRRSNSEGKEPAVLITPKKVDSPKQKPNSGTVSKVVGRLKGQTLLHEQFYVQKRAENEVLKRKSYLPYRQVAYLPYRQVGLFINYNGMGKMLAF